MMGTPQAAQVDERSMTNRTTQALGGRGPQTRALVLSACALGAALSGCVTASELQDARVLRRGEQVEVLAVEVQLQTAQRVVLKDNSGGDAWPIFPVGMVGVFRGRTGLSDWLEVSYHLFNPLIFEGLLVGGGGIGLKAQLWGADPSAATAGALMVRGEGYGAFVSADDVGALGVASGTVGVLMSAYFDWGALTITPKGVFEAVGIAGGGRGSGVSAGASFGLRAGQGKGSMLLEFTALKSYRGGVMSTFGVGWQL